MTKPANKPKRKATANPKRARSGRRRYGKPKMRKRRSMPSWLRNLLAVVMVIGFTALFYYLFIRPYAYRWRPCYGQKGYGVCLPNGYEVHGLDISHYQGNIDWPALASNKNGKFPLCFVFMKATEGGDLSDSTFVRNFDLARQHGFIRGAYHFFTPRTDVAKQADFFIKTVDLKPGDLPPVLDIELLGNNTTEELQQKAKLWLSIVEKHYGVKPIVYASYKFKMKHLNDSVLNTYPYWIAHYYVDSVRYIGKWKFWQHTDVGTVPGVKEDVDLNVFNGTLEDLRGLLIQEKPEPAVSQSNRPVESGSSATRRSP